MANSGSFSTSQSHSRGLSFNWSLASQSITNNTSTINWSLVGNGSYSGYITSGNFQVVIDGAVRYSSGTRINLYNGTVVATGSVTLGHDNAGNRSFSASAQAGIYTIAVNCSGSGSWALPTIARYSVIQSADNFNDEGNPTIKFTNPSGGKFALRAKIEAGGNTQFIVKTPASNATSYTFNLTTEERNKLRALCPNSNSLSVRFTICSMSGSTELSWSSLSRTMTIVNANPKFSTFTYKDTNATTVGLTGNNQTLIKGQSTLQATISSANKMIAQKSATAKNYSLTIDTLSKTINYSASDITVDLGKVVNNGTKRLNVRAYDSRNNSASVYKDITVYDYAPPVINATATRLNNWENQTTLVVSGTYSRLTIGGTDKNTISKVQYRYRIANGSWGNWTALTPTITTGKFTCPNTILSLPNTNKYEFQIQAIDKLTTTTKTLNLGAGSAIFFISSNKKMCYINDVQIATMNDILPYDTVESW